MYSCSSSHPCCLKSTSKEVCTKKHDAHCPDCELHDKSIRLSPQECSAVVADKDFETRLNNAHGRRFLDDWAQHHRIKYYKKLSKKKLVQNIAKALSGDKGVLSTKRSRVSPKLKTRRSKRNKASTESTFVASKVRLGYKTCICGAEECKTAMSEYFERVHDYSDPTKYFPWLYVNIPKMPKPEDQQSRSGMRPDRVLNRQEKRRCRLLFCRHLQLKQDMDYTGKVVAFPVHFPLIWQVLACMHRHDTCTDPHLIHTGPGSNGLNGR